MREQVPYSGTQLLEPGIIPRDSAIEGQIAEPIVDQATIARLEAAYQAPSAAPHEAATDQAIDPTQYAEFKQSLLTPNQPPAPEETAPSRLGQLTPLSAETVKDGRVARLGRIALRMTGLTSVAKYTKDSINDARISVNELRADNHKFSAQRADRRVQKAQAKLDSKLDRELELRQHAAALRAEADSGDGTLPGREFKRGRAEFTDMRAEKRQRKAQKLAQKVLSRQIKRNDHLRFEEELRERAERLDNAA